MGEKGKERERDAPFVTALPWGWERGHVTLEYSSVVCKARGANL